MTDSSTDQDTREVDQSTSEVDQCEDGTERLPEHGDRVEFADGYDGMGEEIAEYVGLEGLVVAGRDHLMNTTDDRTLVHFDENPTDRGGGPRYWVRTDCLKIVNAQEGFE